MSVEMRSGDFAADIETFWRNRPSLAAPGISPLGGRGLIALKDIEPGTLIDMACTVEILEAQAKPFDKMQPLGDFYFAHPANPKAGLMAYGLMSFCNHSDHASADMCWVCHPSLGWLAQLVAVSPIAAGEEITYRYKCPLWFAESA